MAASSQFVVVLLSVAITSFASASCPPPDCNASPPPESPPYYMLADPQNCHKFYYCYDDSSGNYEITDAPFWCQDHGAVFSQENQLCGNYTCDVSCSGTCTPYECNPADAGQGKKPDPYDCSKYYICPDDQAMQCEGDKPFFDGDQCQGDESKCCHCKPYCHQGELFKNVPDPVDCASYYFCVNEYDFPTAKAKCASGHFNPFTSHCDEKFPCVTLCENVVGCDGCIDIFTCKEYGNTPKCPQRCDSHYYYCGYEDIGSIAKERACPDGLFFEPDTEKCVTQEGCSYDPPSQC